MKYASLIKTHITVVKRTMSTNFIDSDGTYIELNNLQDIIANSSDFPLQNPDYNINYQESYIPGLLINGPMEQQEFDLPMYDLWGEDYIENQLLCASSNAKNASKILLDVYYASRRHFKIPNNIYPDLVLRHFENIYHKALKSNLVTLVATNEITNSEFKILENIDLMKECLHVVSVKKLLKATVEFNEIRSSKLQIIVIKNCIQTLNSKQDFLSPGDKKDIQLLQQSFR